ncbi:MAG: sigma-54 dependent transcriptional regulator [Planctomycetota bacterium]|jgi:DNA-binding NtrC family response regulator|nr:sigma-54 dependent transcriptional regulator [Planctomycetota bacterium]
MKTLNNESRQSILLVDDDQRLLESMADWMRSLGFEISAATSIESAKTAIQSREFDLIITDLRFEKSDGFDLLRFCQHQTPETPVLLLTGYATMNTGVEALRAGAFDLLTKPIIDEELLVAIDRALSQQKVIEENHRLKAELDHRFSLDGVVGFDESMKKQFEIIESVADTRATILITGESGTGKSLIARSIHRASSRRKNPFVELACGALPETLLESELFGHVAGSFTGATGDKIGKFKQADSGTIFLDEIGTASQSLQVKLLRVLQDFEFEQVGGTETHHVDSRVILATNENLETAVAEGRFRQDLFYRINVINLELPPLRERTSDIPLLVEHFLKQACDQLGKAVKGFEEEAILQMQGYHWPGNVRELQNIVERAILLSRSDYISPNDLPPMLRQSTTPLAVTSDIRKTLKEALEEPERQIILRVLKQNHYNRNETAEWLGINRTTLYKKMKKLGLEELCPQ